MPSWNRRRVLRAAGAAAAAQTLSSCGESLPGAREPVSPLQPPLPALSFQHSVASGDPLPDGVMLWTRVTPAEAAPPFMVDYLLALDPALTQVVQRGQFATSAERDYTVKPDVRGLAPATSYYYQFSVGEAKSPVGRTRTTPALDAEAAQLRFAVASCSDYGIGFFHAYRRIAERQDLDAVLHLGDYLYEYGGDSQEATLLCAIRACLPEKEILTLEDYRARHAQYKTDPDLQEAHRQHPWIVVWDDHETADNSYKDGAVNHQPETEGSFEERKRIAHRAYAEWMPIRNPDPTNLSRIYRRVQYGKLADLLMLDTRIIGRDQQAASTTETAVLADPKRSILGPEQADWLDARLTESAARWKFLGQQVIFANLIIRDNPAFVASGTVRSADAWDGYQASRARVLSTIKDNDIHGTVVLTGDVHASWALDIPQDPFTAAGYDRASGAGSLAVEFVTPGITMPSFSPGQQRHMATNPHIKYVNTDFQGYLLLDVTPQRVQAEWWYISDVRNPTGVEQLGRAHTVQTDADHLDPLPVATASRGPANPPPFAA